MTSWSEAQHPRDDRGRFEDGEAARSGWARRVASSSAAPAPHVSSVTEAGPPAAHESWWDDDELPAGGWAAERERPDSPAFERMSQEMRDWRALGEPDVPQASPDTSPKGRLLGLDTQEGADRFARLCAYRDAGYTGPLDQDNNIPDPGDPENWEWMSAAAAMQGHRG